MSKVLVIPDVHLKPEIFDHAEAILKIGKADYAVQLGDMVDDWGQGANIGLYERTLARALKFAQDFPKTIWCWGNHDISYINHKSQSGYSEIAALTVREGIAKLYDFSTPNRVPRIAYRDEKCVFSHAGIMRQFLPGSLIGHSMDNVISILQTMSSSQLWSDDSPLWARSLGSTLMEVYHPEGVYQVVGHTPVINPTFHDKRFIAYFDTWSTYSDGLEFGNRQLCIVDTENPSVETTEVITYATQKELMK